MTEEEIHDDLVRRVLFTKFKNLLDRYYDDLYQEGRLALLVMVAQKDEYWGVNAFRWATRCMWRYLFKQWGRYEEGGDLKMPVFTDQTEVFEMESTAYNKVLTDQLLKPLSKKERQLIECYYMDEATPDECADITGYTKGSVQQMLFYIRKKIVEYEASGKAPKNSKTGRVFDTKTGFFFKNAVAAAKTLSIDPVTLRRYLSGKRDNPTTLVYA